MLQNGSKLANGRASGHDTFSDDGEEVRGPTVAESVLDARNKYLAEFLSGSDQGSYLTLINF